MCRFWALSITVCVVYVNAWPAVQQMGNQMAPGSTWPWVPSQGLKLFDVPKGTDRLPQGGPISNPDTSMSDIQSWNPQQNVMSPFQQPPNSNPFGSNLQGPMRPDSAGPNGGISIDDLRYPQQPPTQPFMQQPPPPMSQAPLPLPPPPPGAMPMMGQQPMLNHHPMMHDPSALLDGQAQRPFGRMMTIPGMKMGARPLTQDPYPPMDLSIMKNMIDSSMKLQNAASITVQYNVTYTFSPWGWKASDMEVANANFHAGKKPEIDDIAKKYPEPRMSFWSRYSNPDLDTKPVPSYKTVPLGESPLKPVWRNVQ